MSLLSDRQTDRQTVSQTERHSTDAVVMVVVVSYRLVVWACKAVTVGPLGAGDIQAGGRRSVGPQRFFRRSDLQSETQNGDGETNTKASSLLEPSWSSA